MPGRHKLSVTVSACDGGTKHYVAIGVTRTWIQMFALSFD